MNANQAQPRAKRKWLRRLKIAILALAAVVLLAFVALSTIRRSGFYGTYVCENCGAERTLVRSSIAGVVYRRSATIEETAVSRALTVAEKQPCHHRWYLVRWTVSSGSLLRLGMIGEGGEMFSPVRELLADDDFARDLVGMSSPRQVWHLLCRAHQASPKETNRMVGDWWFEGMDREPFAEWWAHNEGRLKQLGAPDVWRKSRYARPQDWRVGPWLDPP